MLVDVGVGVGVAMEVGVGVGVDVGVGVGAGVGVWIWVLVTQKLVRAPTIASAPDTLTDSEQASVGTWAQLP